MKYLSAAMLALVLTGCGAINPLAPASNDGKAGKCLVYVCSSPALEDTVLITFAADSCFIASAYSGQNVRFYVDKGAEVSAYWSDHQPWTGKEAHLFTSTIRVICDTTWRL